MNAAQLPDSDKLAALVSAYPHALTFVKCGPCEDFPGMHYATYCYGRYYVTFGNNGQTGWALWMD